MASKRNSNEPPTIQFLSFDGCPCADAAQAALENALERCGMRTDQFETVDVLDPDTPMSLANWGSPTVLVNGEDVSGYARGDGVGCRIYATADRVPTAETIAAAIQKAVKR